MRTLVMGIVNVTPDSFSDGGKYARAEEAIARAHALVDDGADILDIGGESTRPGATALTGEQEWERIEPVVRELVGGPALVSVDTYHAYTARAAADAGVDIINDVTGGAGDSEMFASVAANGARYVLQHGRGTGQTMNSMAVYGDVVSEVAAELRASLDRAIAAGIQESRIIADPGFGFAKVGPQDWDLAAGIDEIIGLGFPVLVGVSRKRFLAEIHRGSEGPLLRDDATAALTSYFAERGVWGVRVHEVSASRSAVETVERLAAAREERGDGE